MAVIKSENFDGVPAPTMPPGWSGDGNAAFVNIVTTISQFQTSPNGVTNPNGSSDLTEHAWWNPNNNGSGKDGNGGNCAVTWDFIKTTDNLAGEIGAICRAQALSFTDLYIVRFFSSAADGLVLYCRVANASSQLFQITGDTNVWPNSVWFRVKLTCSGDNISVRVQRLDDNRYLHNNGNMAFGDWTTFGTTPGDAISLVDSTAGRPTASGYAGMRTRNYGAGTPPLFADNFLFETVPFSSASSASSKSSASSASSAAVIGSARIFQSAIISGLI